MAKKNSFIIQGSILAGSQIISGLIGIAYRIPLTNIIGDEGNGYYSAAYSIYAIILLLSSYSLPLAVSKMVSARLGRGEIKNAIRIFKASMIYATLVGAAGFAAVWFGADWFAKVYLSMEPAKYALKTLAPTIWIMSYLGVMRGYYQGQGTMAPTALSQIIEQIVNAIISVSAAYALTSMAIKSTYSDTTIKAYGAAGGTIGTGMGALSALILFLILFISKRKIRYKYISSDEHDAESYKDITRILFFTVVPVILSTAIYNIVSTIDVSLFGNFANVDNAAAYYGIYSGKYKLLINIPISLASAMASSLIPALSRARAAGDDGKVTSGISKAIRITMILAIPSAIGLAVVAPYIITLFFGHSPKAVLMLRIGIPAVILYALSTISNGILQGTSHMRLPVRHAIISLSIHIISLIFMLKILNMGIIAVVIADMIFALCMSCFNAYSIKKLLRYRQEYKRTFIIPAISAIIMGIATFFLCNILHDHIGNYFITTIISILAASIIYGFFLFRLHGITETELRALKGGTKIIYIFKKLHIL